jgi:hypothetical protein
MSPRHNKSKKFEPLNGSNWITWRMRMEALLYSMDCWNIADEPKNAQNYDSDHEAHLEAETLSLITGKGDTMAHHRQVTTPIEEDNVAKDWKKREARGASELLYYLTDDVLLQIRDIEGLRSRWLKLHELFEQRTSFEKVTRACRLFNETFSKGQNMKLHVSQIDHLIKDAEECGLKLNEEWRKIIFLLSLRKCTNYQVFTGSVDITKSSWLNLTTRAREITYTDERTIHQANDELNCFRCGIKGEHKRFWERKGSDEELCFECGGKGQFSRDHRNPQRFTQYAKKEIAKQDSRGKKIRKVNLVMNEEEENQDLDPDSDQDQCQGQKFRLDRDQIENSDSHEISMYADSGAGISIVNNKRFLSRYSPCHNQFIVIGDGKRIQATGQGELVLKLSGGTIRTEALYVPEIKVQLLSISQLAKEGTITTFDDKAIIGMGRIQSEDYIYC